MNIAVIDGTAITNLFENIFRNAFFERLNAESENRRIEAEARKEERENRINEFKEHWAETENRLETVPAPIQIGVAVALTYIGITLPGEAPFIYSAIATVATAPLIFSATRTLALCFTSSNFAQGARLIRQGLGMRFEASQLARNTQRITRLGNRLIQNPATRRLGEAKLRIASRSSRASNVAKLNTKGSELIKQGLNKILGGKLTALKKMFATVFKTIMKAIMTALKSFTAPLALNPVTVTAAVAIIALIAVLLAKALSNLNFFAQGGFPTPNRPFIAREAGPELVGTISGRNAVINNEQIVAAVSQGVYRAFMAGMNESIVGKSSMKARVFLNGKQIAVARAN